MNTELKKNAEGYTDPTAAATLTQPEPGDVWTYDGRGMCLVIKNHGPFSSILLLVDDCGGPDDVKIMTAKGPKYTDPRRITYGLHRKMGRYLETVSVECFDHVVTAVENALDIYLPRQKADTAASDEATQPVGDDPVNHPTHYTSGGVECIDAIRASMTPEEFKGFLKGNAMKYLWRYNLKGKPAQDLEKANWYLSRLTKIVEG